MLKKAGIGIKVLSFNTPDTIIFAVSLGVKDGRISLKF
jgi:hypothetical protein